MKQLLSSSVLDWLYSTWEDVDEIDSPVLQKSIKSAQQKLHDKKFARIRKNNGIFRHLENARPDFIGKRFDLTDGVITIDDWLEEWASDKVVLQNLQALQKGEECQIPVLKNLWERYETLKIAKGGRAPMLLMDVLKNEMERIFKGIDYLNSDTIIGVACKLLLTEWKEYISLVHNTVGNVTMKEQALERYLEEEKNRLRRRAVENLLGCTVKWS